MVQERSGGRGITLLVLNDAKIARMFEPTGQVFRWAHGVGREVAAQAVLNVVEHDRGYQTGRTAKSIGHSVTNAPGNRVQVNVRAESLHSLLYHEGTLPHPIYPHTPLTGRVSSGTASGGLVFFWRLKGRVVRLPRVSHPGFRGNPFLRDAMHAVLRLRRITHL